MRQSKLQWAELRVSGAEHLAAIWASRRTNTHFGVPSPPQAPPPCTMFCCSTGTHVIHPLCHVPCPLPHL